MSKADLGQSADVIHIHLEDVELVVLKVVGLVVKGNLVRFALVAVQTACVIVQCNTSQNAIIVQ